MASANTFYARPVYVKTKSDLPLSGSRGSYSQERLKAGKSSVSKIPTSNSNVYKKILTNERRQISNGPSTVADMADSSAPPRPPPPRPVRDIHRSGKTAERESPHHNQMTPEPKPLTKTNVTNLDEIWRKDNEDEGIVSNDILAPPLQFITPETTEEMWKNFDPHDVLDSASDSSADTMIMMTTEEEKKNDERIKHSLKEYKTVKFQDLPTTNKLKLTMQNGNTSNGTRLVLDSQREVRGSSSRQTLSSSSQPRTRESSTDVNGIRTIRGYESGLQTSSRQQKEPVRKAAGSVGKSSQHASEMRGTRMLGGSSTGNQQVNDRKRHRSVDGSRIYLDNSASVTREGQGVGGDQGTVSAGYFSHPTLVSSNSVTLLHVKTDTGSNSSPESVSNSKTHNSPNEDSPDDGYGTNSSSGTSVSSPFSSSFGSVFADLSDSLHVGGTKGPVLPNGAIKPNSVRESWAVKRKQRLIESQDDSVQEQLRQLTIIEEEGSGAVISSSSENQGHHQRNINLLPCSTDKFGVNVIKSYPQGDRLRGDNNTNNRYDPNQTSTTPAAQDQTRQTLTNSGEQNLPTENEDDHNYVNVSQTEFARRNRQLYVIGEENRRSGSLPRHVGGSRHGFPSNNEINAPPSVPPHKTRTNYPGPTPGSNTDTIYDQVYEPGRSTRLSEQSAGQGNVSQDSQVPRAGPYQSQPQQVRGETNSRYSTTNGSGNIYVSPTGEEGFYALNQARINSIASTSEDSFSVPPSVNLPLGPSSPQSPLETMSGDLLEKWSDMDRNYRNYCGFDETNETQVADSKIFYFQQKTLKSMYGQDNYYRPSGYNRYPDEGPPSHPVPRQSPRAAVEPTSPPPVSTPSPIQPQKQTAPSSSPTKGSKFFQILPNMFKASNSKKHSAAVKEKGTATGKKHSAADKEKRATGKKGKGGGVVIEPSVVEAAELRHRSLDLEQEPEYMNMQDLPQYSLANIELENALKKGQFVSLDNLHKRPVFASSKDIQHLFSKQGKTFDSIHNPGSNRHSFHAMPLSYRYISPDLTPAEDMRPRAASTSATMRTPSQMRSSVESRMAVLQRKAQGQQSAASFQPLNVNAAGSVGNLSMSSNNSVRTGTRTRLDSSGSSGGLDPKLSTLV